MKRIREGFWVILTLMGVFSFLLVGYTTAKAKEPGEKMIKVGALFALSGPAAPGIKDNMQGVKAAADAINEKGGIIIEGQKYLVEIIPEDNKSTPEGIIAAANKLVHLDKVQYIVGPVLPWLAIAMTPISEEAKVLRCKVNGTGTPAEMNRELQYTFSTFMELQYIKSAYGYFVESYPHAKKIAIVGPDEPGGQIFVQRSQREAEARGLQVVLTETYSVGTEDFYPIMTKVLAKEPDGIELGVGVAPWYAGLIKHARELGFKGPMFAPSTTGDIYLVQAMVGKDFAYDVFFLDEDLRSSQMPALISEIAKRVKDNYGVELTSAHCYGWEALWCLIQAIETAQSLDPTMVAKTWEKMKSIDTLYGPGKMGGLEDFGINHVIMKPRPLTRLEQGEVKFIKFINP